MEQTIGHTPLIGLGHLSSGLDLHAELFAKLEMFNPTGSAKDRAACFMLQRAEREGGLKEGGLLVCATSGNMGISLSALAAVRGYRSVVVMPSSMSRERRSLLSAFGAEVVLVEGGMARAEGEARTIAERRGGVFMDQFSDPANPEAHYRTTGPEIMRESGGAVDIFVAGVGSGGTISGAGKYLKEQKPSVRTVAVEPAASPVLSGGRAGVHGIQGIGAGSVPAVLCRSVIDDIFSVREEDARSAVRLLARKEGILAGISSGAALHAAIQIAGRRENGGKKIVVLLPDTGERYLSTGLFV